MWLKTTLLEQTDRHIKPIKTLSNLKGRMHILHQSTLTHRKAVPGGVPSMKMTFYTINDVTLSVYARHQAHQVDRQLSWELSYLWINGRPPCDVLMGDKNNLPGWVWKIGLEINIRRVSSIGSQIYVVVNWFSELALWRDMFIEMYFLLMVLAKLSVGNRRLEGSEHLFPY